jgi:hypothetical protein
MSRSTVTYSCRWCGRDYSVFHTYNCCGEKCAREWAAANPRSAQLEREKMQQTAEMNEGCARAFTKGVTSVMIFAAVAFCIVVGYFLLNAPTDKKTKLSMNDIYCRYCEKNLSKSIHKGYCAESPNREHEWLKR